MIKRQNEFVWKDDTPKKPLVYHPFDPFFMAMFWIYPSFHTQIVSIILYQSLENSPPLVSHSMLDRSPHRANTGRCPRKFRVPLENHATCHQSCGFSGDM